jgi:hypothetical protein
MRSVFFAALCLVTACAGAPAGDPAGGDGVPTTAADTLQADPSWRACVRLSPGSPSAVCVDFGGSTIIADNSPPRLIAYSADGDCQEFQAPAGWPGFRPCDVSVRGFFVYAIDETDRMLLRWDSSGSWRDVLLNFNDLDPSRRTQPYGLDVDTSGRVAITDIENHRVMVLDTYLNANVVFGNYGSFDGQLDSPEGVSWTPKGDLLVTDSGNRRLQIFSDAGTHRRTLPAAGAATPMRRPRRAVTAPDGTIYVADPVAKRVFAWSADGLSVRALVAAGGPFVPTDVVLGRDGRLFVTDAASKSLRALKVM